MIITLIMYFKYHQAFSHLLSHPNLEHHQEFMENVDAFPLGLFKLNVFTSFLADSLL